MMLKVSLPCISAVTRKRIHPLGGVATAHSTARTKLESVLNKAQSLMDNRDSHFTEAGNNLMFEYAQCPVHVVDCSKFLLWTCIAHLMDLAIIQIKDTRCELLPTLPSRAFLETLHNYADNISLPVGYYQQAYDNPFFGPWPSARRVSRIIDIGKMVFSTQMNHLNGASLLAMTGTCLLNHFVKGLII